MSRSITASTFLSRLAELFPGLAAARVPIQICALDGQCRGLVEATVVEYGSDSILLFGSRLPLECADRLRVQTTNGSLDAAASIIAVQHDNGAKAVAARFVGAVPGWIWK